MGCLLIFVGSLSAATQEHTRLCVGLTAELAPEQELQKSAARGSSLEINTAKPLSTAALIASLDAASDPRLKTVFQLRSLENPMRPKVVALSAADFKNANFIYGRYPQTPLLEGQHVLGPLEFGYNLGEDNFRTFSKINYVLLDAENRVVEVGGSSDKLLQEFKSHLFGRTLTQKELDTIVEINTKIFAELRTNPEAKKKLEEFSHKRGWPAGLAEKAGLVYYSKEIFDLKAWATDRNRGNNYSLNQLRDAGWLLLTFDGRGKAVYKDVTSDSIKIPYYKDLSRQHFEIWQARMLADDDGPKYRSWQLDRSILNNPAKVPGASVYNWNAEAARGQTVVITEGALKCIVGENATGIMHVGIEGISQFDQTLAKTLILSGAKEFIVVLDRDPAAMDHFRVDNVSDSKRASYEIAQELVAAGAAHVRVGTLPDAFDGNKVGIDDVILAKGVEPYLTALKEAVSPHQYAQNISLDLTLQTLKYQRKEMRAALDRYANTIGQLRQPTQAQLNLLREAKAASDKLNADFKNYLKQNFAGASSITEPAAQFASIPKVWAANYNNASKEIILRDGRPVNAQFFANPILLFDYVFSDSADLRCQPGPCIPLDYTAANFENAFNGNGLEPVNLDLRRGLPIASAEKLNFATSKLDFGTMLITGRMAHDFPPDTYRYEFNVKFGQNWVDVVPLVIFKKSSGMAVAMARLAPNHPSTPQQKQLFSRVWSLLRPSIPRRNP